MSWLHDFYEFLEAVAQLSVTNPVGLVAAYLVVISLLAFLLFCVLRLVAGVSPLFDKMVEALRFFSQGMRGANVSFVTFGRIATSETGRQSRLPRIDQAGYHSQMENDNELDTDV